MAKRFLSAFLALAMVLALLGGVPATAARAAEAVTLKVCTPLEDQETEDRWLVQMLSKFEQAHPELEITWEMEVASIGDIGPAIAADPQAGADVFLFPNDQIGTLLEAGALSRLTGDYLDQVKNGVSQTYVDSVSDAEGGVYGFPITCNTWFMYYNKSVFNEEDVKSMETMLEKGVVSFPLTNSWYIWSFYAAAGGQLFGARGADAEAGIDLGENALAVTEYLVNLVNHENFLVDQDGTGNEAFRDGTAGAFFSGSWDYNQMYEVLGEDLGAVAIPTVNIGGEDKQLLAFAGSKAVGVNACSDHEALALELASLLASEEAQLLRWQQLNTTPALTSLRSNADIQNAMITAAEMDTMARTSTVQPTIAAMGGYWGPAATFGIGLADGTITMENAAEKTDELLASLNPTSIGGDADVGAGEEESDELVPDEYGQIVLNSFEDLKKACGMTLDVNASLFYDGAEPLIISESITLPQGVKLNCPYPMEVSEGVTFTVPLNTRLYVWELAVNGTLENYGTVCIQDSLTVSGTMEMKNRPALYLCSPEAGVWVSVEGAENINGLADSTFVSSYCILGVADEERLNDALTHAAECDLPYVRHEISVAQSDVTIEGTLTIPENTTLELWSQAVGMTIASGGKLTVDGALMVRSALTVDGSLENNNLIIIEHDSGDQVYDAILTLNEGAEYSGNGDIVVWSETLEAPDAALPGMDLSTFNINHDEDYCWILTRGEVCEAHSFGDWTERKPADCVNGGEEYRECTVCGAVETRETEALGHSYTDGVCTVCGEKQLGENETERDELPTTVAQGTLSNITWHLDSEGCLTLSGKGDMPHCELESDVPWLDYAEQITSARIEKGITTVGIYSFYRCLNLESVSIPDGVTAIGSHAFEWCRSLKEVILPESLKTIGLSAFYNCDGMEKLELGGVETIANDAFNMCRSLTEVTFPATLKEMRNYSFASCDNLTTITFEGDAPAFLGSPFSGTGIFPNETVTAYYPGDNTTWTADAMTGLGGDIAWKAIGGETVEPEPETIGGNCGIGGGDNLTWTFDPDTGTLTISGSGEMMDVSSAIYAPWAGYADQITGLVIEEGAENVGAFMCANLTALSSVSLPASLRWIEEASFEMTTALTEITFPETLESIGYSAFHGAGLTKVTLPANTALSPNAFSGCTSLIKAVINTQGESMGAAYGFCGCTALTDVTFGEGVTLLANYMFAGCTALKTITVPGSVDTISGNAFENCTSLYEVTLEDGIRLIGGYAFAGCTALREIELPASVEVMEEGIFNRCEKLEKILFRGSAPEIDGSAFSTLKVEAWYLQDDETWNEDTMKYYGSTDITWVPYGHTCDYTAKTVAPTCTEIGYTVYTCACGDTYMEDYVDALGHAFADGECTRCGEADPDYEKPAGERYVTRLSGDNRFDTAFKVADQMKVNLGIEKFDAIIVASGTNFADALSGSYLAAVKNAPILLSFNNTYNDLAKNYIRANLKPGGTVYILGGPSAVPISMESGLSGFTVKRLAGTDRFGTNLAILEEAGVGDKPVLVCTGLSFADSLSASASKLPILLVWNKLLDTQKAFLDSLDGNQLYVIGGETAVSTAMQETLEDYGPVGRIGGGNRFETSVMIAEFFFDKPESAVLAYAWNYPDGLCGGALASTMDAPLILTMTKYETAAQKYVADQGIESGLVLGGTGLISEKSVELIFPEKPQEKPGTGYEDELPIG